MLHHFGVAILLRKDTVSGHVHELEMHFVCSV
jgi:hypothetical protein